MASMDQEVVANYYFACTIDDEINVPVNWVAHSGRFICLQLIIVRIIVSKSAFYISYISQVANYIIMIISKGQAIFIKAMYHKLI